MASDLLEKYGAADPPYHRSRNVQYRPYGGIEDFMNETHTLYLGTLFSFEDVKARWTISEESAP